MFGPVITRIVPRPPSGPRFVSLGTNSPGGHHGVEHRVAAGIDLEDGSSTISGRQ